MSFPLKGSRWCERLDVRYMVQATQFKLFVGVARRIESIEPANSMNVKSSTKLHEIRYCQIRFGPPSNMEIIRVPIGYQPKQIKYSLALQVTRQIGSPSETFYLMVVGFRLTQELHSDWVDELNSADEKLPSAAQNSFPSRSDSWLKGLICSWSVDCVIQKIYKSFPWCELLTVSPSLAGETRRQPLTRHVRCFSRYTKHADPFLWMPGSNTLESFLQAHMFR